MNPLPFWVHDGALRMAKEEQVRLGVRSQLLVSLEQNKLKIYSQYWGVLGNQPPYLFLLYCMRELSELQHKEAAAGHLCITASIILSLCRCDGRIHITF